MGVSQYKPDECQLFIDSCKWSLPIIHSVIWGEHHLTAKMFLCKLCYNTNGWYTLLKNVNFFVGEQDAYVKY